MGAIPPDTNASLTTLVNAPEDLTIGELTVSLSPLIMRELPAFQQAIAPIVADLKGLSLSDGIDFGMIQGAILAHLDLAMDAVALMARVPRERIDALGLDDFITLAAACFRVNGSFFMTRVLPTLTTALDGLFQAINPTGSTPPPASSAPGTATKR